ncbi:MAG: N-acetylmuramoyl-L-alanine amidase [Lachnospiraceae bacterium]|nr:N-acetylmuramoyl-L-alanine amidase [Lachnospiraceae bacterium]
MLLLSGRTAEYVATGSGDIVIHRETIGLAEDKKSETTDGKDRPLVVIDAGHGGIDPGKVGINQALEKDINLAVAKKLKRYLELSGVEVLMTREGEDGLYRPEDSNKKVQDMKNRVAFIDSAGADLAVSIHQNSYSEEYVRGAQVFYYATSLQGKAMAQVMQETLAETLDKENHREAKANDSYYLLKKTQTPIIIAECGFLSNRAEAELLLEETYQDRVAWAIHLGILRYMASES